MLKKLLITGLALVGVFGLMAAFWPAAFHPISATFVVPNTTYSPPWAHLVLLGVLCVGMSGKHK